MRAIAFLVAGALILAVALAAFAPATLIDDRLAAESGGMLRLVQASGTIWRGEGTLTDEHGKLRIPLGWKLAPLPLWRGIADVTLEPDAAAATPRGRFELAQDRVRAEDVEVALPVAALVAATGLSPLHAGGELSIRSQGATLGRNGSEGTLLAEWRNARIVLPQGAVADFGTVTARLAVRGNTFAGPMHARGGQLTASGELAVARGSARIDLEIVPAPSAPAAVRSAIAQLGPADARGAVRLSREFR